ncbi:DNA primase [Desulfatibacillum alkenivorans DSM 16219]|uniref:DNA primase n=1 Tax=Desulfatibacillum alkenivorans DSM 16219 TaxID=1121393 RepID=A0A1M6X3Z7_9BACT|nr:DNA primase [Desulfatibacillum alkenivorans]SHL00579.1 DNA primase [Desulfatibacillum alkenivorans DSM 16219]
MARFSPDDQISHVRNSVNIVDVISDYMVLKKAGNNFVGLCPFHAEKTPSFSVNPDRQFFHCFGCGEGGDVFDFVMRQNNLTFPEALASLAARAGIELAPRKMTPQQQKIVAERDALYAANDFARDFFVKSLNAPQASQAREYMKKREMPQDVLETFMLGFAPDEWRALSGFLQGKGVPPHRAEKAGLLVQKEGGGNVYDRFRNRIIFPIHDISGRIAGFGGRVMDDALPKYLNSPQTPIYDKKRMLYGLYQARQECRKTGVAFMVEGYFDVLALYAHGVRNAVATCGTALSPDHVRIIKGYAKKVVLVFDSDTAGINAARKSLPLFEAEKVQAKVLVLPAGHDPDSFVRDFGAKEFLEAAENSQDMIPFLMESAIARHGLSIEGKANVVAEIKEQVAAVSDGVTRSLYIKQIAEKLGVDEAAVLDAVRDAAKTRPKRLPGTVHEQHAKPAEPAPDRMETAILQMMVRCPECAPKVAEKRLIKHFSSNRVRALGLRILEFIQAGGDPGGAGIMNLAVEQDDRSLLARILSHDDPLELPGCMAIIDQFEKSITRRNHAELDRRIQQAQTEGHHDLALRLLVEKNELLKALQARNLKVGAKY